MKLLIHAGIHRTGTTSLQRFLSRNREGLARQSIAYPGPQENHQSLAWHLYSGDSDGEDVAALLSALPEADVAVLSGEDFCLHTDLGWVAYLAEIHETEVVFYLRRQDHWVMSWYNQHVKWPFDRKKSAMSPQEFLAAIEDFYWLDYAQLLKRWSDILGQDRVHVKAVEHGQIENVISDFLGLLGITRDGLNFNLDLSNNSLPVHVLEIARHLNLHDKPNERQGMLIALEKGLEDKKTSLDTVYSPEERNSILNRFSSSNVSVARSYFDREALFFEPAPSPDAAYFCFPDISRDELLRHWVAPVLWQALQQR